MKKVEIKWEDGRTEICGIVKKYNNGDYQLDRKTRKRMELVSSYEDNYLHNKYKGEKYIWLEVYLKDTKGYEMARVRRVEENTKFLEMLNDVAKEHDEAFKGLVEK